MIDPTVTSYPHRAKAITPHDTNDLTDHDGEVQAQQVFVGGAGDVVVLPNGNPDGQTVTFSLEAGEYVPCVVKRVLDASTTATGLIGLW